MISQRDNDLIPIDVEAKIILVRKISFAAAKILTRCGICLKGAQNWDTKLRMTEGETTANSSNLGEELQSNHSDMLSP
ncbi:unnamed protein product [Caretta caretta]